MRYTLVQHSGYGVAGKPEFSRAVEEASVSDSKRLAAKIERAGGVLFASGEEAQRYAFEFNYPPGVEGLVPRVRGGFHAEVEVGGLRLYLPSEQDLALVDMAEIMES